MDDKRESPDEEVQIIQKLYLLSHGLSVPKVSADMKGNIIAPFGYDMIK